MGADVGLDAPNPPDTNGGEGDLGGSHTGGIMDSRWSNFFDLSGGCSAGGVAASCSGVTSPDGYMEGQMRAFFGDRWYDLPGHDNEIERAEAAYVRGVYATFAAYNSAQTAKTKPKLKPPPKHKPRHLTPEEREAARKRRDREGKKGNNEDVGGGVAGGESTGRTRDACGDMADFAQGEANNALRENPNNPRAALRQFDRNFATLYAGRPATSLLAAGRQWLNRGAGATQNPFHLGETGFRQEFRDTGEHAAGEFVDQTHHFAFYLSMGINENGSGSLWAAQRAHRARDNQGDANLGRAGYEMGTGLRDDLGRLGNIGDMIRQTICDPNRNPAH
jgi:hypothetical protein